MTRRPAEGHASGVESGLDIVEFEVAGQRFGVLVGATGAVIRVEGGEPGPGGEDLPVLDAGEALGLVGGTADDRKSGLVLLTPSSSAVLAVERVAGISRLPAGALLPTPSRFSGPGADLVRGIARLDDRMIVLLEVEPLLQRAWGRTVA